MIHSHSQIQQRVLQTQSQPRPLVLTKGHIFQGQITKLYPNHLASLSLNGMQVTAQLEAALTVGGKYLLEVLESEGMPRLRVLGNSATSLGNSQSSEVSQIIEQLALPKSKNMDSFIRQLTEQQIPFTRQSLIEGANILSQLKMSNQEGISLMLQMMQRQLPLTETTFQAYQMTVNEPSLTSLAQQLAEQLSELNKPNTAELTNALRSLLNNEIPVESVPLRNLLLAFSRLDESSESGKIAKQLLARLGFIEMGKSKNDLYQEFQRALLANQSEDRPLQQGANAKQLFETTIAQLSNASGKNEATMLQQLLTILGRSHEGEQILAQWNQLLNGSLSANEKTFLSQLMTAQSQSGDTTVGQHLRSLLQMVGYQYEHDVARLLQGELTREQVVSDKLKALLIQAQQQDLPEAIRDNVNNVLLRVTGQQLLSQEQAGMNQFIMQIPLSFGSFQTEMTMQWEGKKQENGEMDPNHCRILFYLTLEKLNEVIVDVQIQNRVMNVSIFNEGKKPEALIDLLQPTLQKKLEKHNYKLLSLKWGEINEAHLAKPQRDNPYLNKVSYEGVDVRI